MIEDQYDGSLPSFVESVHRVTKSSELLFMGTLRHEFKEILESICDKSMFDILILDAVDSLILQRAGRQMARLVRTLPPGEQRTPSGRAVLIEMIDVRAAQTAKLDIMPKVQPADHTVATIVGVVTVIVASILGALFSRK